MLLFAVVSCCCRAWGKWADLTASHGTRTRALAAPAHRRSATLAILRTPPAPPLSQPYEPHAPLSATAARPRSPRAAAGTAPPPPSRCRTGAAGGNTGAPASCPAALRASNTTCSGRSTRCLLRASGLGGAAQCRGIRTCDSSSADGCSCARPRPPGAGSSPSMCVTLSSPLASTLTCGHRGSLLMWVAAIVGRGRISHRRPHLRRDAGAVARLRQAAKGALAVPELVAEADLRDEYRGHWGRGACRARLLLPIQDSAGSTDRPAQVPRAQSLAPLPPRCRTHTARCCSGAASGSRTSGCRQLKPDTLCRGSSTCDRWRAGVWTRRSKPAHSPPLRLPELLPGNQPPGPHEGGTRVDAGTRTASSARSSQSGPQAAQAKRGPAARTSRAPLPRLASSTRGGSRPSSSSTGPPGHSRSSTASFSIAPACAQLGPSARAACWARRPTRAQLHVPRQPLRAAASQATVCLWRPTPRLCPLHYTRQPKLTRLQRVTPLLAPHGARLAPERTRRAPSSTRPGPPRAPPPALRCAPTCSRSRGQALLQP
jgi:hypothetical protein